MAWSPAPNFKPSSSGRNQPLSASAHLNALRRNAGHLLGMYQAPLTPLTTWPYPEQHWSGFGSPNAGETILWRGWVLKQADLFHYRIEMVKDAVITTATLRIEYGTISQTHSNIYGEPNDYVEGYLDTSSLADGAFYEVRVVFSGDIGNGELTPSILQEEADEGYQAMAAFETGDTPTADEWQALSDNETQVHAALILPRIPVLSYYRSSDGGSVNHAWMGYIYHRHDYLHYKLTITASYYLGTVTCEVIYAGDTLRTYYLETAEEGKGGSEVHEEVIDISTLHIFENVLYPIEITVKYEGATDWFPQVKVHYVREQPSVQRTPSGWSSMPEVSANNMVDGTSDVKPIRDNIEWLTSRVDYANRASPYMNDVAEYATFWRFHPWLVYLSNQDDDATPKLELWRGEWIEKSLPKGAEDEWLYFDLGAADIYPGQMYRVSGVLAALEVADAES